MIPIRELEVSEGETALAVLLAHAGFLLDVVEDQFKRAQSPDASNGLRLVLAKNAFFVKRLLELAEKIHTFEDDRSWFKFSFLSSEGEKREKEGSFYDLHDEYERRIGPIEWATSSVRFLEGRQGREGESH